MRLIARFYDPLGYIALLVLGGRLLFQQCVKLSTGWDDLLPAELVRKCEMWAESLEQMEVKISRCLKSKEENVERAQLHLFTDAIADAYGSCVYLRTVNESGSVTVKLVASKAKVVPINCTATIPRLELMGVVCVA